MRRRLWVALRIYLPVAALLLVGVLAMGQIARNAPAFTAELRTDSVLGDWRLPGGDILYNRGDFYFELGYGFLRSDLATALVGEEMSPEEVFDARIRRATDLFERSIEAAPGNVDAWTNLAWSHLIAGDARASEEALRTSWRLAPLDRSEAPERLAIAQVLDEEVGLGWREDEAADAHLQNDVRLLLLFDRRALDPLVPEDGMLFGIQVR